MKLLLLFFSLSLNCISTSLLSQQRLRQDIDMWKKAVVNIEAEGYIYSDYFRDSIFKSKRDSGYNSAQLKTLMAQLNATQIATGTAIYIKYGDRKYLVTAKHVLSDQTLIAQKEYENKNKLGKWEQLEAIYPRISLRTPFSFYLRTKEINTFAVLNNNFVTGAKAMPFCFISDSTGDGIGIISLQYRDYKVLDTLLQKDGYLPISVEKVCSGESINILDEIYAIGFPEMVSIIGKLYIANNQQSNDVVAPFVVKGNVALYEQGVQHYFVDLTITPGNSGSPIIKNGKLIGIVSGINKYKIINESINDFSNQNLFGIGHLVNIINTYQLINNLKTYKEEEDLLLAEQIK